MESNWLGSWTRGLWYPKLKRELLPEKVMTRGMVPPNGGTFDLCERHILSYPLWNKICIYMIQERNFLFFYFFLSENKKCGSEVDIFQN